MAWTTPRSWTPGETVTAAIYNQHVRDNLIYLKNLWGASADAYGHAASVSLSSNTALANNTWFQCPYDTVDVDPDGWYDETNDYFVVPEDGLYLVTAVGMWDTNTAGSRWLLPAATLGAVDERARASVTTGNTEGFGRISAAWTFDLAADDVVSMWMYQTSGASRNIVGTGVYSYSNHFAIMRIS